MRRIVTDNFYSLTAVKQLTVFLSSICLFLLLYSSVSSAEEFSVSIRDDLDIPITAFEAKGEYLLLWLPPEWGFQGREQITAQALAAQGVSVWLADLHTAFFLTPTRSSLENIVMDDIVALMHQAVAKTKKKIILFSAGRGAEIALRASNAWRATQTDAKEFSGLILLYPNLFQGTPEAGDQSKYLSYLSSTNESIYLLQPELSAKRWHIDETVIQLSGGGSDVHAEILPDVSDGFDLREERSDRERQGAISLPKKILNAIRFLKSFEHKSRKQALIDVESTRQGKISAFSVKLHKLKPDAAPPLILKDIDGKRVDIREYKGKTVLINFWATWCPPCVKELPSLEALQDKLKDSPFKLITVDVGEDEAAIRDFTRKVEVSVPVLMDQNGITVKPWKLNAFPTSYLVDNNGIVTYGLFGAIAWDDADVVLQLKAIMESKNSP